MPLSLFCFVLLAIPDKVNHFFYLSYLHLQGARGDQCDSCGKLINAIELKVKLVFFYFERTEGKRLEKVLYVIFEQSVDLSNELLQKQHTKRVNLISASKRPLCHENITRGKNTPLLSL